jgi:hypothetical protein
VCNPDYTLSLACEDRDRACKKKHRESEQKHWYGLVVMLRCVLSREGHVQVRSRGTTGIRNANINSSRLAWKTPLVIIKSCQRKVNQCSKIYKGHQRTSTRWIAGAATPQVIKVITLPIVKVIICVVIIIFLLYIVIFFCSL